MLHRSLLPLPTQLYHLPFIFLSECLGIVYFFTHRVPFCLSQQLVNLRIYVVLLFGLLIVTPRHFAQLCLYLLENILQTLSLLNL